MKERHKGAFSLVGSGYWAAQKEKKKLEFAKIQQYAQDAMMQPLSA